MKPFKLVIPASTSNIGPGYDTLGIALKLYNRVEVTPGGRGLSPRFESGAPPMFRKRIRGMLSGAAKAFRRRAGVDKIDGKLAFYNETPIARGLGSSATFRVGVLAAMNRLAGNPLPEDDLLVLACSLEKHTENCVAAMRGGLNASGFIGEKVAYASYDLDPRLTFVAAIPHRPLSTAETRKLLPKKVKITDAVFNMNRTALLVSALAKGEYSALSDLLEDRLHQPYRAKIITPLFDVIKAARESGAWGGFLSGAGSTIIAITTGNSDEVGAAMKKTLDSSGWPCEIKVLLPENRGLREVK